MKKEWKRGGIANGKPQGGEHGTIRLDPRLPVLRVTVTEAHCFAKWLGGRLPEAREWDKAAGRLDGAAAPFGKPEDPVLPGDIAIDRKDGPMPVGTARRDVSPFGCRDMSGNGKEWTGTMVEASRRVPAERPDITMSVVIRGQSYIRPNPLRFDKGFKEDDQWFYDKADGQTGFRVVLLPD